MYKPAVQVCFVLIYRIDLSIDAMDVSGEHQLDVLHSIYKQRLSPEGQPINEEPEEIKLGTEHKEEEGENKKEEEKPKQEQQKKEVVKKEPESCGRLVLRVNMLKLAQHTNVIVM